MYGERVNLVLEVLPGIAQLGKHLAAVKEVPGSIPGAGKGGTVFTIL